MKEVIKKTWVGIAIALGIVIGGVFFSLSRGSHYQQTLSYTSIHPQTGQEFFLTCMATVDIDHTAQTASVSLSHFVPAWGRNKYEFVGFITSEILLDNPGYQITVSKKE